VIKIIRKLIRRGMNKRGFEVVLLKYETSYPLTIKRLLDYAEINTVIDIGANIGQFAELLRETGYTKRIISFEPLNEPHKILKLKAEKDKEWVIPERMAVGNKIGTIQVNISANSMSSSVLQMLKTHADAAPESTYIGVEECPITTLDHFFSEYKGPFDRNIFLKVDTQGYEMQVLEGAEKILERAKLVELEISFTDLYKGQVSYQDLIKFMESKGFQLWSLFPIFTNENARLLQADALFLKE
jgi:FkbM family methyltransferase